VGEVQVFEAGERRDRIREVTELIAAEIEVLEIRERKVRRGDRVDEFVEREIEISEIGGGDGGRAARKIVVREIEEGEGRVRVAIVNLGDGSVELIVGEIENLDGGRVCECRGEIIVERVEAEVDRSEVCGGKAGECSIKQIVRGVETGEGGCGQRWEISVEGVGAQIECGERRERRKGGRWGGEFVGVDVEGDEIGEAERGERTAELVEADVEGGDGGGKGGLSELRKGSDELIVAQIDAFDGIKLKQRGGNVSTDLVGTKTTVVRRVSVSFSRNRSLRRLWRQTC